MQGRYRTLVKLLSLRTRLPKSSGDAPVVYTMTPDNPCG